MVPRTYIGRSVQRYMSGITAKNGDIGVADFIGYEKQEL